MSFMKATDTLLSFCQVDYMVCLVSLRRMRAIAPGERVKVILHLPTFSRHTQFGIRKCTFTQSRPELREVGSLAEYWRMRICTHSPVRAIRDNGRRDGAVQWLTSQSDR